MNIETNWTPGITLAQIERAVIEKALRFFQGNKTRTAFALGIAIRTLDNKLSKYDREDSECANGSTSMSG